MHKLRNGFLLIIGILVFFTAGSVTAAEVISGGDSWTLEAGETLNDDLYLSGNEMVIDGTVNGDVVAIGDFLHIQGEVNGDVIFIGGGLLLNGTVRGDVRTAALSIDIQGTIEESLTLAGSGVMDYDTPFPIGVNRSLVLGTHIKEGTIGGDVYAYSGFLSFVGSRIDGDVLGQVNGLELQNSEIRGNVDISVLQIAVDEDSRVLGAEGFRYSSISPAEVSTLTENINYDAIETPPTDWLLVLRTVVGRIAGLSILGWIILRFRPNWIVEPVAAINTRPVWAAWLGFTMATSLFLGSFAFAILVSFFFGGLAALTFSGFIIMGLGTVWVLSPLVTGLWFGQRFASQPFQGLLFGCSLIIAMQAIPLIGFGISAIAFALAVGGLVLAPRIEQLPSQV
ncbi:MAG: hypothetical protein ACI85U_003848 [Candidatus Promineifilaceae bacterium]|jgi:hypothetical protein